MKIVQLGTCPVCASGLSGPTQACPRCETVHHADCWTYVGGCAIFACGVASNSGLFPRQFDHVQFVARISSWLGFLIGQWALLTIGAILPILSFVLGIAAIFATFSGYNVSDPSVFAAGLESAKSYRAISDLLMQGAAFLFVIYLASVPLERTWRSQIHQDFEALKLPSEALLRELHGRHRQLSGMDPLISVLRFCTYAYLILIALPWAYLAANSFRCGDTSELLPSVQRIAQPLWPVLPVILSLSSFQGRRLYIETLSYRCQEGSDQ